MLKSGCKFYFLNANAYRQIKNNLVFSYLDCIHEEGRRRINRNVVIEKEVTRITSKVYTFLRMDSIWQGE